MNQLRKRLTYANVMSSLAVFLVLGGATAFAAGHLGKNTVGTKQLKKGAVTAAKIKNHAVTGAKVELSSLGTVPSATNATTADKATTADSATKADKATTAASSERLAGVNAGEFVQKTARAGEVLTGQLSAHYPANGGFFLVGDSYRSALPPGVPTPTLAYTTTTTSQCPGIGKTSSGILCVYGYNNNNVNSVATSGNFGGENKRFGFSLDVFPTTTALSGYFIASWAYQVP